MGFLGAHRKSLGGLIPGPGAARLLPGLVPGRPSHEEPRAASRLSTQGLQCSSLLVMTCFLLKGYNMLPKKELLVSPWVGAKGQINLTISNSGSKAQYRDGCQTSKEPTQRSLGTSIGPTRS